MGVLNLKNIKQRDLLARFDISFTKLDNIAQMAMFSSQKFGNWKSDQLALSNLTCKTEAGEEESNKSLCLKKALMSVSNIPKDCEESIAECVKEYPKLSNQLKDIFPSLKPEEMTAFTMPGGVQVLNSYLDSSCQMDVPISKAKNGDIEYVKACGFLLADVNGNTKPNNLLISRKEPVDRFLIALTSKGLVKSNLLSELAGCPEGSHYDSSNKTCEPAFTCPIDMDRMREIESANSPDLITKQFPLGVEHPDCYEIICKYKGSFNNETKQCPQKCAAEDETRNGGLWVYEGGQLSNVQSKTCCIPISNQADMASVGTNAVSRSKDYCLISDIYMDKSGVNSNPTTGWKPIGNYGGSEFKGNFYGNGHVIKNLYINNSVNTYSGLFGAINSSGKVVENLGFENPNININSNIGGNFIGSLSGAIYQTKVRNVYLNLGSINVSNVSDSAMESYAGGLAGSTDNFSNCYNGTTVRGNGYAAIGGITSGSGVEVSNCYNFGDIVIDDKKGNAGGIAYRVYESAKWLYNSGKIDVASLSARTSQIGGIAAVAKFLSNSYNIGEIGSVNAASASGVAVSNTSNGMLTTLYNSGTVINGSSGGTGGSGIGSSIGGITVSNVYNSALITNSGSVGGNFQSGIIYMLFDSFSKQSLLQYSYNTGFVSNNAALVNTLKNSIVQNNFYLRNGGEVLVLQVMSGSVNNNGGGGESYLKQASIYPSSWDRAIWKIANGFYPTHQAAIMPPQPHRDCRRDQNAHGGCFDVLNTQNAWDFNYVWAWKTPSGGESIADPVFRWQCMPYKINGFDCCRPSYANSEPKLDICPALTGSFTNRVYY